MNEIIDALVEYIRRETGHVGDISPDDDLLLPAV
jgi:hypothetical protein